MTHTIANARIHNCTHRLRPYNPVFAAKRRIGFHVDRAARYHLRAKPLIVRSVLKITETATGVQFPLVRRFGEGDEFRCLGAAPRLKRILFLNAKVYAIALYVEAAKAAKELKIRDRGDFFKDEDNSSFCDAIMDGAFNKVLQINLVRDVTSDQFLDAIDEAMGPKLRFIGANDTFEEFKTYVQSKELKKGQTIDFSGTTILPSSGNILLLHWNVKGHLDVGVVSDECDEISTMEGMKQFDNVGFCRSMFELYMGNDTIIPEAKEAWASGAKLLLESTKM